MLTHFKRRRRRQRRISLRRFAIAIGPIGLSAAARLWRYGRSDTDFEIQPKFVAHPLLIRANTSDFNVFQQVFIEEEYAGVADLPDVGLIVDAGANVGYSSIYFLSKYPDCQIVAIEPDPSNFATLQRNLAPYAGRVTLLQAGLWSHRTGLALQHAAYRDGREWSKQVRECEPAEAAEMEAIDVATILSDSHSERISLLKMDIEGAEAVVFAAPGCRDWLDKVDAMAVELHDDSEFGNASDIFHTAIEGQGFLLSRNAELTICRRA